MASSDLRHNEPLLPIRAGQPRPGKQVLAAAIGSFLFLLSLIGLLLNNQQPDPQKPTPLSPEKSPPVSRGSPEGVSEKAFRLKSEKDGGPYPWTNAMLTWQRSGFHFQPQKNWMNDPDGPLYHMGWYHLFYQYNPDSAVWGNITWGHAVSKDLIHWLYLPISMVPDHWFDINGVWTGSATILPDGNIVMLYTGDTVNYVQVQNLAYPANLSDPLLLDWVKYSGNPVMRPPSGIKPKEFRDPTTAWVGPDGIWRLTIGSKINGSGISLIYKTTNFTDYELTDVLHSVAGTGMWECLDFYPVSTTSGNGLNTSAYGPGTKHVLKASLDADKHDYYALGTYDPVTDKWIPDNPELDVGIGLRIDYGKYYASKTFYDQNKGRRILWGWVGETDTEGDDLLKGWASLQTIPREVTYDVKTGTNILQQPVEEVESLRLSTTQFNDVLLEPGSVVNLNITSATQLDVTAEFTVDSNALNTTVGADVIGKCSSAAVRGALGPFGLLVLADKSLSEQTPVYFYIAKATDGTLRNWFCTDQSRSTVANGVGKQVYGGQVPVLDDENYTMRLLVDHSIVEAFGQRGRTCITSRVYPTQAIYGAARVFLFNNATLLNVTASVTLSVMDSADIHSYPL